MPGRDPCQSLLELLATMHTLRTPGGCPWDAAQTPESLAPFILEEACETIEAIESGTPDRIADELGDLLLQIVFQADIFNQRGLFDFADVTAGINAKLLRRHPHVFTGHGPTGSMEELDRQWERIKGEEQAASPSPPHPFGHLSTHLPALQRAQKLINRARRRDITDEDLLPGPSATAPITEKELAAALLLLVHRADKSGLNAEQVLRRELNLIHMRSRQVPAGDATKE
jgi:uncharacterized protein YabN with tetrapyrrole methylase and pyrophosphatase domain